jgi:hypothetical protein
MSMPHYESTLRKCRSETELYGCRWCGLVFTVEADDGFFLPRLQPKVAGHPTVVLIHSPVALPPVVELTRGCIQPRNESSDVDLGLLRPAPDEIHHLIPHIMRHPGRGQSSPRFFLTRCAPPSARPGPRPWSAPSSPRTQSASVFRLHGGEVFRRLEGGRSVHEELFLPAIEHRRLQAQFFTQIGNWHLVQKMAS